MRHRYGISRSQRKVKLLVNWISDHKLVITLVAVLVILINGFVFVWAEGYLSYILDIPPPIKLGAKVTDLSCNYAGSEIHTNITTYRNWTRYYHLNRRKNGLVEKGDYSKYVFESNNDTTIKQLADNIKSIGSQRGFSDDQTLELATCFIQNIPYNDSRGQVAVNSGNKSRTEQYPYETLNYNSGICTDKTYLGSLLLNKLGYGTSLFIFPDKTHMALGIKAPAGYTDFGSNYVMMELTSTGFAPGEIPSGIDDSNGRPSETIKTLNDVKIADDPSKISIAKPTYIQDPTLVIDVSDGNSYQRIIPIKNLENKIVDEIVGLVPLKNGLVSAYSVLLSRESSEKSAYIYYTSLPSTTLDCGYKYDYSFSYYLNPYGSPYTYRCDTVVNSSKNFAYTSYLIALGSYNSQVNYYNQLLSSFNNKLNIIRSDIASYDSYEYN